ncbi:MAG: DNA polymerase III subunit gamma/tau, partial [Lysobacter sp.]|nr:DNA polymerase III subunit gamma/tau [Lysobacter sp.]
QWTSAAEAARSVFAGAGAAPDAAARPVVSPAPVSAPQVASQAVSMPAEPPAPARTPVLVEKPQAVTAPTSTLDADGWLDVVASSGLKGPTRVLAEHAGFVDWNGTLLRLSLTAADEHLQSPASAKALAEALAPALGAMPQIRFESVATPAGETLHQRSARERDARQGAAEAAFLADPGIQQLMSRHGATLVPDSIRPFDE